MIEPTDIIDVLVVTPSADRTTATLCAASLLRWARTGSARAPRGISLTGGAAKDELRRTGVKVVQSPQQPLRTVERAFRRAGLARAALATRMALYRYLFRAGPAPDVILASTVESAWPAARHRPPGTALVTYCHQAGDALDEVLDRRMMRQLVEATDGWIAADEDIAEDLVARGVATDAVTTIRPFIAPEPVARPRPEALARAIGRRDGEVVVGGFGLSRWHDGPDVFLRLASVVRRRHPDLPVRFVWVGAPDDGPSRWILDHDVRHADLADRCVLTGSLDDTDAWLDVVDVVAVTSRIEPPPPIAVQATTAAVPVVGFDLPRMRHVAADVAGEPAVTLVAPLDMVAMADAVADLASDPGRRARAAEQMREHRRGRAGSDEAAAHLWETVGRAVGARRGDER